MILFVSVGCIDENVKIINAAMVDIANMFLDQYTGDDFSHIDDVTLIWSHEFLKMPETKIWNDIFPQVVRIEYLERKL